MLESSCHTNPRAAFCLNFWTIWVTCQSLKAIIRTKSQFLRVNSPRSVQWHWRSFFLAYIHLFSFSLFFSTIVFCFFSQVPKWVYWWSLPKLRNGQLLQYVHSLSVSAWIGACAVGAAFLSLHLPQISPRARRVLPGLILTASACRMRTLTKAIVLLPLFVTSWLSDTNRCVRLRMFLKLIPHHVMMQTDSQHQAVKL